MLADLVPDKNPLPSLPSYCILKWKRVALSWGPTLKSSSKPNYLPKAPLLIPSNWGLGLQYMLLGVEGTLPFILYHMPSGYLHLCPYGGKTTYNGGYCAFLSSSMLMILYWWLEISQGESTYTIDFGKCYKLASSLTVIWKTGGSTFASMYRVDTTSPREVLFVFRMKGTVVIYMLTLVRKIFLCL